MVGLICEFDNEDLGILIESLKLLLEQTTDQEKRINILSLIKSFEYIEGKDK